MCCSVENVSAELPETSTADLTYNRNVSLNAFEAEKSSELTQNYCKIVC